MAHGSVDNAKFLIGFRYYLLGTTYLLPFSASSPKDIYV